MPRSRRERRLSLATYYQKALQELEQRYAGATISTQEIRAEFQQDWQQIERVHDWCAANAEQDVGAAVLCSKFAGVAGTLLENQLSRRYTSTGWKRQWTQATAFCKLPRYPTAYDRSCLAT